MHDLAAFVQIVSDGRSVDFEGLFLRSDRRGK